MRSGTVLLLVFAVIGVALLALTFGGGQVLGLDDDAFASLVYTGLWTTLLGSGLLVAFAGAGARRPGMRPSGSSPSPS